MQHKYQLRGYGNQYFGTYVDTLFKKKRIDRIIIMSCKDLILEIVRDGVNPRVYEKNVHRVFIKTMSLTCISNLNLDYVKRKLTPGVNDLDGYHVLVALDSDYKKNLNTVLNTANQKRSHSDTWLPSFLKDHLRGFLLYNSDVENKKCQSIFGDKKVVTLEIVCVIPTSLRYDMLSTPRRAYFESKKSNSDHVGTKLINEFVSLMRKSFASYIILEVANDTLRRGDSYGTGKNEQLIKFYKNFGFYEYPHLVDLKCFDIDYKYPAMVLSLTNNDPILSSVIKSKSRSTKPTPKNSKKSKSRSKKHTPKLIKHYNLRALRK